VVQEIQEPRSQVLFQLLLRDGPSGTPKPYLLVATFAADPQGWLLVRIARLSMR
jgi:hypothetical protein